MIAVEERPAVAKPLATTPPMPREHGAWGILLIPFATAVGVSGVFDLKVALLLVSVLGFYVARTSWLKMRSSVAARGPSVVASAKGDERGDHTAPRSPPAATGARRWTGLLLATSFACVAPLVFLWHLWWLVAFGAVAAPLAFRKTERSVAMQLVAVAGLTLTAPAAWYAATGGLDRRAWLLWLLNVLYFAGGVFYVKMHVAAAIRRKPFESIAEKIRFGAVTLIYYGALAAFGVVLWPVGLAYAPVVVRSVAGVWRLSPTLRIKRLGWTEVAYSIVFATVLIVALR